MRKEAEPDWSSSHSAQPIWSGLTSCRPRAGHSQLQSVVIWGALLFPHHTVVSGSWRGLFRWSPCICTFLPSVGSWVACFLHWDPMLGPRLSLHLPHSWLTLSLPLRLRFFIVLFQLLCFSSCFFLSFSQPPSSLVVCLFSASVSLFLSFFPSLSLTVSVSFGFSLFPSVSLCFSLSPSFSFTITLPIYYPFVERRKLSSPHTQAFHLEFISFSLSFCRALSILPLPCFCTAHLLLVTHSEAILLKSDD